MNRGLGLGQATEERGRPVPHVRFEVAPLEQAQDVLQVPVGVVLAGDVNAVARLISMFFMVTYGSLCAISFLEHFAARPQPGAFPALASLTTRELEVLRLLAAGGSNADIAARLDLSEATVKTHVGRLLDKLDVRDRVQAVIYAYESGLVEPVTIDQ